MSVGPVASLNREALTLRPDLSESARVRAFLKPLLERQGFSVERCFDIQVAVSEAVANAVEHAHGAGVIGVEVVLLSDRLEVSVSGSGEFRLPVQTDGREHRGLGLPLMAKLADHLALYSGTEGGTLVALTFYRPMAALGKSVFMPGFLELMGEHSLLQAVLDSVSDDLVVFDREWRVLYANRASGKQAGLDPGGMVGQVFWQLFPSLRQTELFERFHEAMETGRRAEFTTAHELSSGSFTFLALPFERGLAVITRRVSPPPETAGGQS